VYKNILTRSVLNRLNLWLLTATLLAALPLAARAQGGDDPQSSFLTTCNPRENRADFDGDCKTDLSTFNRSTGEWASVNSSNSGFVSFFFGQSGDIATPGDYNGDGKTDRAVFRPGNGFWYIETDITSTPYESVWFGQSGDIPVARDYDGDNKADVAVFRPGNGLWCIIKSSDKSESYVQWGQTGDRVVPGDYDGDGKTDVAIFRPESTYGTWWILRSSNGSYYNFSWGFNATGRCRPTTTATARQTSPFSGRGAAHGTL
jgi:hypothetical protein